MAQDTGKFRENTKDQFYTKPDVAIQCVHKLLELYTEAVVDYCWIEPSAGCGSFLEAVPAGVDLCALDIDPKKAGIQKQDFLKWKPVFNKKILVYGNPPFGRQGSAAKAFIQHAASFASLIAFILPRSFLKPSMQRAFPAEWHCAFSSELPGHSFLVNEESYDVPCVFQIWEKKCIARAQAIPESPTGFSYVKSVEIFDLAFRRVGVNAGKCWIASAGKSFAVQSHHFLRLEDRYKPQLEKIRDAVNATTFPSNTTGPRSLSKGEINMAINAILLNL